MTTTIKLQMPDSNHKTGTSFDQIPSGRSACYAVNVVASDLPVVPATTCSPALGVTAGFADPNTQLSLVVNRGEARTFELYMYLKNAGDTTPCPVMQNKFTASQLSQIYFLGRSAAVPIRNDVENIQITASFPGVSQNIMQQNSYPASCLTQPAQQNNPGFRISSAQQKSTGGGMTLTARVGKDNGQILTGGNYKLITH